MGNRASRKRKLYMNPLYQHHDGEFDSPLYDDFMSDTSSDTKTPVKEAAKEFDSYLVSTFSSYDENGDGKISKEEMRKAIVGKLSTMHVFDFTPEEESSKSQIIEEEIGEFFEVVWTQLDVSGKGYLTMEEFSTGFANGGIADRFFDAIKATSDARAADREAMTVHAPSDPPPSA